MANKKYRARFPVRKLHRKRDLKKHKSKNYPSKTPKKQLGQQSSGR